MVLQQPCGVASIWLKDLRLVCMMDNEITWFDRCIQWRVGDGLNFSFWRNNWLHNQSLEMLFPRLFLISTQQDKTIGEMGLWEANVCMEERVVCLG